jgi:hypothetical protein
MEQNTKQKIIVTVQVCKYLFLYKSQGCVCVCVCVCVSLQINVHAEHFLFLIIFKFVKEYFKHDSGWLQCHVN